MSKMSFKIEGPSAMSLQFKDGEVWVCNSNPQVGVYYAIATAKKYDLDELVEAAATVGLNYEALGKLVAILSAKNPVEIARGLGVEVK